MRNVLLTVSLLLVAGSGCSYLTGYRGDGHLTDHGWLTLSPRYVLDLGTVELSHTAKHSYRLVGLPEERMTIEISIHELSTTERERPRPNHPSQVRLVLETSDHQLVILEEGELNSWSWGTAALRPESSYYRRGEMKYIPIRPGVTRPEAIGEKFDRGWGSSFVPRKDVTYILTLEVLSGESAPIGQTRLLVTGGVGLDLP